MGQEKPKLIYVGDPMCSWCYGFAEEITAVKEALEGQVDFQLVMGGLRPYNTQTMSDLGEFLKHHWEDVNKRSKQPFIYDILEDTSFVYDTEPPCRAVVVVRNIDSNKEFEFFKAVQKAFYLENKNTNELETYLQIAENLGMSKSAFKKHFLSEEYKVKVAQDFQLARSIGANSFPTVLLEINGQYEVVASGYSTAEKVLARVNKYLQE